MAKIGETRSGATTSFKVVIPKELAKAFIEKNNGCNEVSVKPYKNGFIIQAKKEV